MAYLIGTDEAGYGPNLGPLVVAATRWEVPDSLADSDLYSLLQPFVVAKSVPKQDAGTLGIADSKQLYSPGAGLSQLERGVLASLLVTGQLTSLPQDWRRVLSVLAPNCEQDLDEVPWYRSQEKQVPWDVEASLLPQLAERWSSTLADAGVRLCAMKAVVCLPKPFNEAVQREGTKGALLSNLTLQLAEELVRPIGTGSILINCDKHGGRNKYNHLLQDVFPVHLIEVQKEGRAESVYRWGPADRRIEARFVAKGESFLPSALGSMIAKYLRELAMKAFNQFWLQQVPDIKPTAGYPVDARRFKAQIAAAQKKLGIADPVLWRQK